VSTAQDASARRASRARRTATVLGPALAVLSVVGLDRILAARSWPVAVVGLFDEPAHLLTAWLVLAAVAIQGARWWPWVLLGAVAIDADHIPMYLWNGPVPDGGGRPVTHSLVTVLALLAAAVAVRRARLVLSAVALGVLLHLLRDVATGPGVPLWWPTQQGSVLLPYQGYLVLLVVLAAVAAARRIPGRRAVAPGRAHGRQVRSTRERAS
jgi:inner membrane protein